MSKTGIQWTNATWNPIAGCTRVSPGCDHCYAFQLHDLRYLAWNQGTWPTAPAQYHRPFSATWKDPATGQPQGVQLLEERLHDPLRWRKPRRVFVNSMSDLFHESVPDEFIHRVFRVMADAKQHTFQVLTKRPQRMCDWIRRYSAPNDIDDTFGARGCHLPLKNVWLGTSVENQQTADERIPFLLNTPAAVRFLSCEPLLEPVDLSQWLRLGWICELCHRRTHTQRLPDNWVLAYQSAICPACFIQLKTDGQMLMNARGGQYATTPDPRPFKPRLSWIIVGGESGPHARPMEQAWAESLLDQCQAADVSFFMKQMGKEWAKKHQAKDAKGRADLHGGYMANFPLHLQVREFPVA